jgi:hypothetical protein
MIRVGRLLRRGVAHLKSTAVVQNFQAGPALCVKYPY